MTLSYHFAAAAEQELFRAIARYDLARPGLGLDFAAEFRTTIKRNQSNSLANAIVVDDCRHCLADRFPYAVVYRVERDRLLIVAVAHGKRKPFYSRRRKG